MKTRDSSRHSVQTVTNRRLRIIVLDTGRRRRRRASANGGPRNELQKLARHAPGTRHRHNRHRNHHAQHALDRHFRKTRLARNRVGDKVIPLIALEVLPAWLAGIVLAAPLAAIMSTVDSLLLLVSSAIVKDVYLNFIKPEATERRIKQISFGVTGDTRNHRLPTRHRAARPAHFPKPIRLRRTRSRLHLARRPRTLLEIRQQTRRNRLA